MASLFTQIINGEIPSYKVYEDDKVFAFLDIYPISFGHTLVVPKIELDQWTDLLPKDYYHIQITAQKIALAIQKTLGNQRIGQVIDGREIPHCHIHLIPLIDKHTITQKSINTPTKEEFINLQNNIIQNLN